MELDKGTRFDLTVWFKNGTTSTATNVVNIRILRSKNAIMWDEYTYCHFEKKVIKQDCGYDLDRIEDITTKFHI